MKTSHEDHPFGPVLLSLDVKLARGSYQSTGKFVISKSNNQAIPESFLAMYKCDGNGN